MKLPTSIQSVSIGITIEICLSPNDRHCLFVVFHCRYEILCGVWAWYAAHGGPSKTYLWAIHRLRFEEPFLWDGDANSVWAVRHEFGTSSAERSCFLVGKMTCLAHPVHYYHGISIPILLLVLILFRLLLYLSVSWYQEWRWDSAINRLKFCYFVRNRDFGHVFRCLCWIIGCIDCVRKWHTSSTPMLVDVWVLVSKPNVLEFELHLNWFWCLNLLNEWKIIKAAGFSLWWKLADKEEEQCTIRLSFYYEETKQPCMI